VNEYRTAFVPPLAPRQEFLHPDGARLRIRPGIRRQGRRPSRGLLLHGPPGAGKTHLAIAILREADKTPVAEVAKKHKISEQTIYNWRRHFGTLEPTDIKRLRGLEAENAKLKRILAERDLEIDTLKEINRRKW